MRKAKQIFFFVILVIVETPLSTWKHLKDEYERIKDTWEAAGDF